MWSILIAQKVGLAFKELLLFTLGAILMRSAGCIYNDLTDIKFDQAVERTKSRPLASGAMSKKTALFSMGLLLFFSALILFQLTPCAIAIGFAALALTFLYPWMKRITYWPQLFLGLAFNIGALMGYASITNALSLSCILLYIGGIAWTLLYDTIYAYQDIYDDLKVGVKSSAIFCRKNPKLYLSIFAIIALGFWLWVGRVENFGIFYHLGIVFVSLHFLWQIITLKVSAPHNCAVRFSSNAHVGWILILALLMEKL